MAAKSLTVECERCGNLQHVERAGRFRDDDFLEVFHELMELQSAYDDLLRAYRRLELRYERLALHAEVTSDLLRNLDPYLPRELQDEAERKAHPALYALVEEDMHERMEKVPF